MLSQSKDLSVLVERMVVEGAPVFDDVAPRAPPHKADTIIFKRKATGILNTGLQGLKFKHKTTYPNA